MMQIKDILKSKIEYKDEVIEQSERAIKYLQSFSWCEKILKGWLANGFGYILCIFCFEIRPAKNSDADNKIWVIVGDIPSVYLDSVEYETAHDALSFYCFLMEEWIEHVKTGKSLDECYPIGVPPTEEYADMLKTRIEVIKSDFLVSV